MTVTEQAIPLTGDFQFDWCSKLRPIVCTATNQRIFVFAHQYQIVLVPIIFKVISVIMASLYIADDDIPDVEDKVTIITGSCWS
jgi:hypothetical protein